jgi:hypothetical protein
MFLLAHTSWALETFLTTSPKMSFLKKGFATNNHEKKVSIRKAKIQINMRTYLKLLNCFDI